MAPTPRRSAPTKTRSAIPQVSWRAPQPAPIVLVSGPEEVCAERAIAGIREHLRAEDPSLEVSDVRADDYAAGTLLGLTSPSLFGEPRLVRVSGVERSEGRRVGKECVGTCRSRGSPEKSKKKKTKRRDAV